MKGYKKSVLTLSLFGFFCTLPVTSSANNAPFIVKPVSPVVFNETIDSSVKRLVLELDNQGEYATLNVYAGEQLIVDNMNVPSKGKQTLSVLVKFSDLGQVALKVKSLTSSLVIHLSLIHI